MVPVRRSPGDRQAQTPPGRERPRPRRKDGDYFFSGRWRIIVADRNRGVRAMARYIQRIALLGKERWIGWEVDGIGTEIPGLMLADGMSDEELRAKGIKEFSPLDFESFLGLGAISAGPANPALELLDEDIAFRLDALQVGIERFRSQGVSVVPRAFLASFIGGEQHIEDPRVQARFRVWQDAGGIEFVGADDCYLRITGRLA